MEVPPGGTYVRKVFERGALGLDLDADSGSFQGKVFKANKLTQPVYGARYHVSSSFNPARIGNRISLYLGRGVCIINKKLAVDTTMRRFPMGLL